MGEWAPLRRASRGWHRPPGTTLPPSFQLATPAPRARAVDRRLETFSILWGVTLTPSPFSTRREGFRRTGDGGGVEANTCPRQAAMAPGSPVAGRTRGIPCMRYWGRLLSIGRDRALLSA